MEVVQAERGTRLTPFADLFFRPGEWLLSRFSRIDQARWPLLWVAGLFLTQTIPATLIRASNLEEGRIIAMARGAMEDGHWLTPFIYGERFAERPVLLSWIAALFGEATGGVTLWSLRIPHVVFFPCGSDPDLPVAEILHRQECRDFRCALLDLYADGRRQIHQL